MAAYVAWGKIGAGRAMIMLPVVTFAALVWRYLLRGLVTGACTGWTRNHDALPPAKTHSRMRKAHVTRRKPTTTKTSTA